METKIKEGENKMSISNDLKSRAEIYLEILISKLQEIDSKISVADINPIDYIEIVKLPSPLSRADKYLMNLISRLFEIDFKISKIDIILRDSNGRFILDGLGELIQSSIYN